VPEHDLRETLEELKQELDRSETLDAETRASLRETMVEIQERLEAPGPGVYTPDDDEDAGIVERLQERLYDVARNFEAEHPTLGASVRRVVNALANMGI